LSVLPEEGNLLLVVTDCQWEGIVCRSGLRLS